MKSPPKTPSALVRLAAVASAAVLAGCGRRAEGPAQQTVAVARVERTTLSTSMTLQAEFMPFQDVLIHAKVSGYVNPIRVDIGDHVRAGDVIAELEVPELGDQLQGAFAGERRAEAEHEVAHLDDERLLGVSRGQPNLVAQQDLDAAAAKDAATEAALADARADADRIRTLVAYTHVTAPFSGIITKRFVDNGALVEAGTASDTEPIVELAQSDLLRLRFPVPEAETPLVRDGGQVTVSVGALGSTFKAPIARNSWGIDRSTRTMVVEVDVPNKDEAFKAGMYASVTLPLEKAVGVLAIPVGAVTQGAHPGVLVVADDGKIEERPVETGMRTASLVEIRAGLAEGERVVVGERAGLVAGETVGFRDVGAPSAQ